MAGKKRTKKRNNVLYSKRFLITIITLLIIGTGTFAGIKIYLTNCALPVNASSMETISVVIPSGSSTSKIGTILSEYDLVKSASKFKLIARLEGYDGKFKAGEYSLSQSMTAKEIMQIISSGSANTKRFTIPEGYTIAKTADKLEKDGFIDRGVFMDLIKNGEFEYQFMDVLPKGANRFEGFLFPETYDIFTTATEEDIINRMLSQFEKEFNDEYYERAEKLGYDVYKIITIASLIEAEAKASADRPLIASVIYNRLAMDMPLQLDATVQYALGETKERLYEKDTQVDSPYNTYKIFGLPPGPICSPGAAAIHAALYPAETDYIYYVLKPDKSGAHNFAKTYSEFKKYKNQYINSL